MLCLPVKRITSRQNPIVTTFRSAVKSDKTNRRHLLLEGVRLIDDALQSGIRIETAAFSISVLQKADDRLQKLLEQLKNTGTELLSVSSPVLSAMSPTKSPSGSIALGQFKSTQVEHIFNNSGPVLLPIGVQDAGNVGAIIRAADGGEASGVIIGSDSADPFGWKALRGGMGSTFRLPIASIEDPQTALTIAKTKNFPVFCAVPNDGLSIYDMNLRTPCLILIGGETAGVPDSLLAQSDQKISIPMKPKVNSLNAAVAAAVIVYEAYRQRTFSKK